MDLFEHAAAKQSFGAPLPERMRPKKLEDVIGQDHLIGRGKLLTRFSEEGFLPSLILVGPPGVGKTTLAKILATASKMSFENLSAVSSGVKDLRAVIDNAKRRQAYEQKRTLLFVDEIHRYNKTQQDALLPHVESGLLTLIGATTENPRYEIVNALLSRCRIITLKSLSDDALKELAERALKSDSHLQQLQLSLSLEALPALVRRADGDARALLRILDTASSLAGARGELTESIVIEASGQSGLRYDKSGDGHYQLASAFIKSMRYGSSSGAIYWMSRMLEGGEDPKFIARRMLIFASEDIGNADPAALTLAVSTFTALEALGLPEAKYPLLQCADYLAKAPKSRETVAQKVWAQEQVLALGSADVPEYLLPKSQSTPPREASCLP